MSYIQVSYLHVCQLIVMRILVSAAVQVAIENVVFEVFQNFERDSSKIDTLIELLNLRNSARSFQQAIVY